MSDAPQSETRSIEPEDTAQEYRHRLQQEIAELEQNKKQIIATQTAEMATALEKFIKESTKYLQQRQEDLLAEITILERKRDRVQQEMRTTYAGVSQDVAVRVQGFKDYLVGSLQDMVTLAEQQLRLTPTEVSLPKTPPPEPPPSAPPQLSEQAFGSFQERIEQLLERYRTLPDYYALPWKLRRTFELTHTERVANWFFNQAGRGAIRTMGTRLQNILVASAIVSVLRSIYQDKVRVLVLATSPERLGEWRRGFQDCLGLTREHFGPDKGVVLFEDAESMTVKGDRLQKEGWMPLVIVDETEEFIAVDLLRFPLFIAYGRDPDSRPVYARQKNDKNDPEWNW